MQALLRYAKDKKEEVIASIGQAVECESPSDSPAHVNRYVELLVEQSKDIASPKLLESDRYGKHLRLDFKLPGKGSEGRILGVGHSDTVWPLGTLKTMPYRKAKGRLWGPGVLDMKSGIAFFIQAARALCDLDIPIRKKIALLVVSDEEVGSKDSRALTETEAKQSTCVLVLEPGSNMTGELKTARKGIAGYKLRVEGKAAHSGIDFGDGASAIVELARQIDRIAGFTDLKRGTTVNPGVISGGTRTNVIAAEARVDIDVRVVRLKDAESIDRKMRSLRPFDKRCKLTVQGGLNRPPMERTKGVVDLFTRARKIGAEMGMQLEESSTGGGSDGNFTAALGIPTLDGLGGVGEGAHAIHESILIDRITDRTALLAGLLSGL
jgi:glutamate carboxypeptidase